MSKKIWWIIGILLVVAVTLIILKKKEVIGKKEGVKVATEKITRRTIIETAVSYTHLTLPTKRIV